MVRLILIICLMFVPITAMAESLENVSVLVPSCDKYAEVWPAFFTLLKKQWPALTQKIFLISNGKTYNDPAVNMITIKNEKSWSDNMLYAIDQIKEDYILIILEDYFITAPVDHERINILFKQMKAEKAAYFHLNATGVEKPHPTLKGVGYIGQHAKQRTALQICIWDKQVLKQLLKSGENPWDFEMEGTKRTESLTQAFMGLDKNSQVSLPISYFGAIWKGYWEQKSIDFLTQMGIPLERTLPVASPFRIWLLGPARSFVSVNIVYPLKRLLGIETHILPSSLG